MYSTSTRELGAYEAINNLKELNLIVSPSDDEVRRLIPTRIGQQFMEEGLLEIGLSIF